MNRKQLDRTNIISIQDVNKNIDDQIFNLDISKITAEKNLSRLYKAGRAMIK